MNQLLSIVDDGLVIKKLSVETLDGPVQTTDDVSVQGNIFVERDIKARRNIDVLGTLTVDTLKVKNFTVENQNSAPAVNPEIDFSFVGVTEKNLDGQGLIWLDKETGSKQFVYKEGNKLWSTMNIDLARDRSYKINKLDVLTSTELGSSVIYSNLRRVGELEGLTVSGQVAIDSWAFFNSYNNSFGINTENPNGTMGVVVDNNVEVIIGSKEADVAVLGTFTSNNLDLITDNKTRVSIKRTGEIIFGQAGLKNAVVKIYGKLEVDEIITSNSDGQNSITFKNSTSISSNNKGLLWQQSTGLKKLVYINNPDKIYSSENLDLGEGKWYSINEKMVLSSTTLGTSITESNLEKVGRLRSLTVEGDTTLLGNTNIQQLSLSNISSTGSFNVNVDNTNHLSVSSTEINIGNEAYNDRTLNLYGLAKFRNYFAINDKKILTGTSAPTSGRWSRGDICYNEEPIMEGYVGWVCVEPGEPGRWCPFGLIMPVRS
jgi:hypothetical protein